MESENILAMQTDRKTDAKTRDSYSFGAVGKLII